MRLGNYVVQPPKDLALIAPKNWSATLKCSRICELANAVLRAIDLPMPQIAAPIARRRPITPPDAGQQSRE